jgi:hypothetical protein
MSRVGRFRSNQSAWQVEVGFSDQAPLVGPNGRANEKPPHASAIRIS